MSESETEMMRGLWLKATDLAYARSRVVQQLLCALTRWLDAHDREDGDDEAIAIALARELVAKHAA